MDGLILGLALPFIGTALGAACVLFMKERMPQLLQMGLTGFAAGVMVGHTPTGERSDSPSASS